jgi:hypothetical protein
MTDGEKEIIAKLTILQENSYSGNPQIARDFTIIKDCKKESFIFVIEQAIACIVRGENNNEEEN